MFKTLLVIWSIFYNKPKIATQHAGLKQQDVTCNIKWLTVWLTEHFFHQTKHECRVRYHSHLMGVIIRHAEEPYLYPNLSPRALTKWDRETDSHQGNGSTVSIATSVCDKTVCVMRGLPCGRFGSAPSGGQGGATGAAAAALTLWTPAGGLTRGPDDWTNTARKRTHTSQGWYVKHIICKTVDVLPNRFNIYSNQDRVLCTAWKLCCIHT